MASSPTFSFPHLPTLHPTKLSKTHLPFSNKPIIITTTTTTTTTTISYRLPRSVDVSQEDSPLSQESPPLDEDLTLTSPPTPTDTIDPRRLEEKFAVLNTGIHECRSCGYLYSDTAGDPSYPIPPGLGFSDLPGDWRCPTCGAAKSFFVSKSVEIAGFAQNQQFGLGGNTLTSGQKALLIYGSLLAFFALFLSGYFLQ